MKINLEINSVESRIPQVISKLWAQKWLRIGLAVFVLAKFPTIAMIVTLGFLFVKASQTIMNVYLPSKKTNNTTKKEAPKNHNSRGKEENSSGKTAKNVLLRLTKNEEEDIQNYLDIINAGKERPFEFDHAVIFLLRKGLNEWKARKSC